MNFSEAIRLGPGEQIRGNYFEMPPRQLTATCALGGAVVVLKGGAWVEALGDGDPVWTELDDAFPVFSEPARCPVMNCTKGTQVGGTVAHLNDVHRWSRAQIADWVQEVEEGGAT